MPSMSSQLCFLLYLYAVQCLSLSFGSGFPKGTAGFVHDTCRYGNLFFKGERYLGEECERITCDSSSKTVIVESCSTSPAVDRFCTLQANSGQKTAKFPQCCSVYSCRNRELSAGISEIDTAGTTTELIFGITKTYTADGNTVQSQFEGVEASGHWSARTLYIFTTSSSGKCANEVENLPFVPALLGSACKALECSRESNYAVVRSCPLFDRDIHQCAFIENGDESANYPGCCPLYMCPPKGYVKKTVELDRVQVEVQNEKCLYKEYSITFMKVTSNECFNLTCDRHTKTITGQICLATKELEWLGCKDVSGIKDRSGLPPLCCPDLVCPDMTVDDGEFVRKTHRASSVTIDVCTHYERYFRKTESVSSVCEKWTCKPGSKEVEVLSCPERKEKLDEYCEWEFHDTRAPFPDCCEKKVCRYPYPTRYPGLQPPPSPLKGTPYP